MKTIWHPLVSIIIPVFNGSNFLSEAIDSALAQTYKNIEVIVVNDGSNDEGKTEKIALSYGYKIKYFRKENGWVSSALNLGIREMKGDYFSWLSHDDVYFPEKIENQLHYLAKLKDKLSILYSDFCYIDEKSNYVRDIAVKHISKEHFRAAFIWGGLINGCTLLIPRQCFEICGVFNETLRTTQDYDLWFRISKKFPFIHMQEILVKSRLHMSQDSQKLKSVLKKEENILYSNFISQINIKEIKQYYEKPVPIFYLDFSRAMLSAQIDKAACMSLFFGLVNFWRININYVYEYLSKTGRVIVTSFKHFYMSFKNNL